ANRHWGWLEQARPGSFFVYAFYLQNFFYGTVATMPLAITWSLAIEEHFYLVWPVLVAKLRRSGLVRLLILLIATEVTLRFLLLPTVGDSTWTLYRMDELAMGALVACWWSSESTQEKLTADLRGPSGSTWIFSGLAAMLPLTFAAIL